MVRRCCTRSLVDESLSDGRRPAPPRAGRAAAPRRRALLALACTALLGVACSDDGDGGSGGSLSIQGTFTNDAPAPAASPALAGDDCELSLGAFAVVQRGKRAVILHGIGGTGGGSIPAAITDDSRFEVDFEIVDGSLGTTTRITGTLDAFFGAARLDGELEMEITGGTVMDCGPTTFVIEASRDTKALPAPHVGIGDADGDWDLALDEVATTCEPLSPSLRSVGLNVQTDFADASAVLTLDDGMDVTEIDAALVDRFIVAKWNDDDGAGTVARSLSVLQFRPPVTIGKPLLFGVSQTTVDDGATTCVAIDELLATPPPS